MITPGTHSTKKTRDAKRKREQLDKVRKAAIQTIPGWIDISKTKLYILSTGSKSEENYKIDPRVCEGLPMPRAKYAQNQVKQRLSQIAMDPEERIYGHIVMA